MGVINAKWVKVMAQEDGAGKTTQAEDENRWLTTHGFFPAGALEPGDKVTGSATVQVTQMGTDIDEQAYDMGVSAAESICRAINDGLKTRAEVLAMPDDCNAHAGDVFPLWDPAKHVVGDNPHLPADYLQRGTELKWVFCDEVEEETEGERLARFFRTSAHEGHEAVRHRDAVVPRPDDREWLLPIIGYRVVALFYDFDESIVTVSVNGRTIEEGFVRSDESHNPFISVPWTIVNEVRGTLRSWEVMRRG